ncbi:uncharacterized protein TrAFT101_011977 [Trichoderma asperellum]|nr:hypothetical protein TrAFT101_011977 [Trichoderma asperellum]
MFIQSTGADENASQIIHWLSKFRNQIQHSTLRAIRLPETGEWFLHQALFQSWCHDEKPNNIFWCNGIPGAGKSVITSLVVDYLLSSFTEGSEGVAYIYCDPNDLCQQTPVMMMAELLAQLLDSKKAMPRPVLQLYERYDRGKWSPQIEDLETTLLLVCKKFRKLFFVMDGLDELGDGRYWNRLVALLKSLTTTTVRLFVTSRPHWVGVRNMLDHPQFTITAHEKDVRKYLIHTMQQDNDFAKLIDGSLQSKIIRRIMQSSQRTFLNAAIQIQSLMRHTTLADIELAITRMSLDTSKLLEETLEDIKRQSKDRSNLAMKTLTWLAHAKRPMLVKELCQGLAISPGDCCPKKINLVQLKSILDSCLGLVVVDHASSVISLRHSSIKEFLRHQSDIQSYTNDHYLTKTCLTSLLFDHFDNCNFTSEEMAAQLQPFPFLRYAAQYWGHHALGHPTGECIDLIARFLGERPDLRCPAQTWFNFEVCRVRRNESSRKGVTGLQIASSFGLHQTVEVLLDRGSEIDTKDLSGWTALHYAAVNGHEVTAEVLLARGADVNLQDMNGWTALHRASEAGQARLVNILLRYGADLHAQDYIMWTALPYAAERGHGEVIRLLLGKGANTDVQDENGRAALHASAQAGHLEVVRLLLDNGADVAGKDQRRRSTLHWAATEGYEDIVSLVLKHGVGVNDQDQEGWTALHRAAENGHEAVVEVLLNAGSASTTKDNEGWTALHWAAAGGHDSIVRLLLEGKANVEMQTNKGWTAMQLAAADGHEGIVSQILKYGVKIESQQQDGWTALHCSAAEGHKSVVLALLSYGADVKTKDKRGATPLLLAAKNGHEEVAKILVERGLEEHAAESLGLTTPLEAAMTRQWETLRVLDLISRHTQLHL